MPDLTAPVTQLLTLLRGADLAADLEAGKLNLPGVWVSVETIAPANMAGALVLGCRLYLIAPDTDPLRALELLGELHTKVLSVLTPDGQVVTQGVVMPDNPTPLPALSVPVNLYTESGAP